MLPGLRFLFAAVMLSLSMLVFGVGAAALLRASHDRFVSTSKIRSAPPPMLAHAEPMTPTLSLLRVAEPEPAAAVPSSLADLPVAITPAAVDAVTSDPVVPQPDPPVATKADAADGSDQVARSDAVTTPLAAPPPAETTATTPPAEPATTKAVDETTKPTAEAPPITVAAVTSASEGDRLSSSVSATEHPAPTTTNQIAALEEAPIEIAAAPPIAPKLPRARPAVAKKKVAAHRVVVVKKRRHVAHRRAPAVTQQQQPQSFSASSFGGT